jgi:hypothetical protein
MGKARREDRGCVEQLLGGGSSPRPRDDGEVADSVWGGGSTDGEGSLVANGDSSLHVHHGEKKGDVR